MKKSEKVKLIYENGQLINDTTGDVYFENVLQDGMSYDADGHVIGWQADSSLYQKDLKATRLMHDMVANPKPNAIPIAGTNKFILADSDD